MNEQPGHLGQPGELVRPATVTGGPVAPVPPHKTPFNARHMPVGVSANTMNVAGRIRGYQIRRFLFFGIPVLVLLAVIAGVWLAVRGLSPLQPKVLTNDIYEYHFMFYKDAEPVNLAQGEGLQDGNRSVAIAKPTRDRAFGECSEVGDDWHRAFIVLVEEREQQVCVRDNKTYLIIFRHDEKLHLFEISYTSNQTGKHDEIKAIMESLKVSVR